MHTHSNCDMEKEVFLETGTYTPCPPVRRTGKGSAEDPKAPTGKTLPEDPGAPTLQAVYRGCRSTHLARCYPRMPRLRPVALAAFPRPGTPRRPWTPWRRPGALDTEAPLGVLGHQGVLGRLGHLGHQGVLRGASGFLGEHRGPWRPGCPWRPRGRWGAPRAPEPIIAKTVFGACLKITDS